MPGVGRVGSVIRSAVRCGERAEGWERALLREYLAACAAFYSEYTPRSKKLPDFDNICMFVTQRAEYEALKAKEAKLLSRDGGQRQGPANALEKDLSKRWISGRASGADRQCAERSGMGSMILPLNEL